MVDGGAVLVWLDGTEPAFCGGKPQLDGFCSARALAMMLKSAHVADGFGSREDYLLLFDQAEAALDNSFSPTSAMSPVSRSILKRMDIEKISRARRRNYSRLMTELERCEEVRAVFPGLPESAVPLGFLLSWRIGICYGSASSLVECMPISIGCCLLRSAIRSTPPKARGSQGAFLRSHATSGIQKKRWPGWLRQ